MVPQPYNMVSFNNLDLAEANGDVVDGIYSKILEAIDACGILMIVDWKFAGVQIPPSYCTILQFYGYITLNGAIKITSSDEVFVEGVVPDPVIRSVQFTENGEYSAPEGVDGFNPVTVDVPAPILSHLLVENNGIYTPELPSVGFDTVTVDVSGGDDPLALTNYIQTSGTQYIDTGYIPTLYSRIEAVATVPDDNITHTIFGVRDAASGNADAKGVLMYAGTTGSNRNKLFCQFSGTQESFDGSMAGFFGAKTVYRLCRGRYSVFNGPWYMVAGTLSTGSAVTTTRSLYLLNLHNVDTVGVAFSCKLYRFRIYEDDTLTMELIPWVDGNNVVCMKDTVSGNLFYNAGTGSFVYGIDS